MEIIKKDASEKKGFFAALLESMVKTGGCCGNGENCGGKSASAENKQNNKQKDEQNESRES